MQKSYNSHTIIIKIYTSVSQSVHLEGWRMGRKTVKIHPRPTLACEGGREGANNVRNSPLGREGGGNCANGVETTETRGSTQPAVGVGKKTSPMHHNPPLQMVSYQRESMTDEEPNCTSCSTRSELSFAIASNFCARSTRSSFTKRSFESYIHANKRTDASFGLFVRNSVDIQGTSKMIRSIRLRFLTRRKKRNPYQC